MITEPLEMFGLVSIILLNSGWVIQAHKVYKTKNVRDLSLLFLTVAFFSFIGLQIYTVLAVFNLPYLIGNTIGLTFVGVLFYFKLTYKED